MVGKKNVVIQFRDIFVKKINVTRHKNFGTFNFGMFDFNIRIHKYLWWARRSQKFGEYQVMKFIYGIWNIRIHGRECGVKEIWTISKSTYIFFPRFQHSFKFHGRYIDETPYTYSLVMFDRQDFTSPITYICISLKRSRFPFQIASSRGEA